jgi:hypothetical protein
VELGTVFKIRGYENELLDEVRRNLVEKAKRKELITKSFSFSDLDAESSNTSIPVALSSFPF